MLADFVFILLLIVANGIFAGAEIAVVAAAQARACSSWSRPAGAARGRCWHCAPIRSASWPPCRSALRSSSATAAAFGGATVAARHRAADRRSRRARSAARRTSRWRWSSSIVSYLSIVIGELVPKSLALRRPETYALLVARPLLALSWIARPLVLAAHRRARTRCCGRSAIAPPSPRRATRPRSFSTSSRRRPKPAPCTRRSARSPRAPSTSPISPPADVMVPREQVVVLPRDASTEDVRRRAARARPLAHSGVRRPGRQRRRLHQPQGRARHGLGARADRAR